VSNLSRATLEGAPPNELVKAALDPSKLAAPTRMLLYSDGGTTTLLQALIGGMVTVRVDEQSLIRAGELELDVRAVLCRGQDSELVLRRRSRLSDAAGVILSSNLVVMSSAALREQGLPTLDVPFGGQLIGAQVPQFREQLTHGVADWVTADSVAPALFRSYLIHFSHGGLVYVHEHFNPTVVPLAG